MTERMKATIMTAKRNGLSDVVDLGEEVLRVELALAHEKRMRAIAEREVTRLRLLVTLAAEAGAVGLA